MVNTRYNGVRVVVPANPPTEEPAATDRDQGRDRGKARVRGRGKVARLVDEV